MKEGQRDKNRSDTGNKKSETMINESWTIKRKERDNKNETGRMKKESETNSERAIRQKKCDKK